MMYRNEVILSGYLVENFKFHHDVGTKIFEGKIEVERRSGTKDTLILQISERKLKEVGNLEEGEGIIIVGELCTHRYIGDDDMVHNKNYVYVDKVWYTFNPDMKNWVKISGVIVKKGTLRTTQFCGKKVIEAIIAIKSKNEQRNTAYVPIIFWNDMADNMLGNYNVGDKIEINGRLQSRDYIKRLPDDSTVVKTTFEVSVFKLIP